MAASPLGELRLLLGGTEPGDRRRRRKVDGRAGTFPIYKYLPPSSLEEALPLFELEVGTCVALSKEGSVELTEGQQ